MAMAEQPRAVAIDSGERASRLPAENGPEAECTPSLSFADASADSLVPPPGHASLLLSFSTSAPTLAVPPQFSLSHAKPSAFAESLIPFHRHHFLCRLVLVDFTVLCHHLFGQRFDLKTVSFQSIECTVRLPLSLLPC